MIVWTIFLGKFDIKHFVPALERLGEVAVLVFDAVVHKGNQRIEIAICVSE